MEEQELHEVILFLMDSTSKMAKRHSQRVMDAAGMGLTVDQWVLLKMVETKDGSSQKTIAEALTRDTASVTRSLDLLERKALVSRESHPESRREHRIVLTSRRQGLYPRAYAPGGWFALLIRSGIVC